MIAFPELLIEPALKAGMSVPQNVRVFDLQQYPHFAVFRRMQCGTSLPAWEAVWHNATVVAAIPEEFIHRVTVGDLIALGWWAYAAGRPVPQAVRDTTRGQE